MHRNLKAIGLTLIAALAVCAFAVSAQADPNEKGTFTAGETESKEEHTTSILHGTQYGEAADNVFTIDEGTAPVTCTNDGVTFSGVIEGGTATTLTVEPEYTDCIAFGSLPAIVHMNECDYTFTQPHTIEGGQYTGSADLHCEEDSSITITVFLEGELHNTETYAIPLCTIHVAPTEGKTEETLGGHVVYTNTTNPATEKDDVTVDASIEDIYWQKTGACGEGEGHDGTYDNTVTVTGSDGENEHDVWISDETTN